MRPAWVVGILRCVSGRRTLTYCTENGNLSPAFYEATLYEAAFSDLTNPAGFPLDDQDKEGDAYQRDQPEMHQLEIECEDPNLPTHQVGYSQLDRLVMLEGEALEGEHPPPDIEGDDIPVTEDHQSTGALHHVTLEPHLEIPPALSIHHLGILTIVAHPEQPRALVCLQCRFLFRITTPRSFEEHKCKGQVVAKEMVIEREEEEDSMEVDPEDNEAREESDHEEVAPKMGDAITAALHWAPTLEYLRHHLPELTKVSYPPRPIRLTPFLPTAEAYGCPFPNCPIAYMTPKTLQGHIREHGTLPDHEPKLVPVQTFTPGPRPNYFKVLPLEAEPMQISVRDQMVNALLTSGETTGDDAEVVGPQFVDVFYKTFPYPSIFPDNREARNTFSGQLLQGITPIRKNGQSPEQQFFGLACLVYMIEGSRELHGIDNIVQRQFGNKLKCVHTLPVVSR